MDYGEDFCISSAGFDRYGNLLSGKVSSVGLVSEPKGQDDESKAAMLGRGKVSSSY